MGRIGNRTMHLKQYQDEENDNIESEVTPLQMEEFVIGMMYCGFPELEAQKFEILNGHRPPTYREITEVINRLRPIFKKMARDYVDKEKEEMTEESTVCVDGSWDDHKDGKLLVFDVIVYKLRKPLILKWKYEQIKNEEEIQKYQLLQWKVWYFEQFYHD